MAVACDQPVYAIVVAGREKKELADSNGGQNNVRDGRMHSANIRRKQLM
jgi:hypothetical protein